MDTSEADAKKRTAMAKALIAALGRDPGVADPITEITARTDEPTAPAISSLKKTADGVTALSGWEGAHYMASTGTGDDKFTGEVRAYSNKAAADRRPFATAYAPADANTKHYTFGTSAAGVLEVGDKVSGSGFPKEGTQTISEVVTFSGTYDEASGVYACTGTCTATARDGKVTALTGGWRFTPSASQTVPGVTSAYLQFGWWVRKDNDGDPVDAGTFARSTNTTDLPVVDATGSGFVGSASYNGVAAGKFAISDPARPAGDDSGHFTATAMLKADFDDDSTAGTLSGTINGFMLNDERRSPWIVSLEEQTIVGAGVERGTGVTASKTKWSLDGTNFGAAGGGWNAAFYENEDDGNNIPDSVIGEFDAMLGATHRLDGAFGAEQQ
ncbi:MAG: hypothetical protein OXH76_24460 [Boseongicola sp.]|nr:hypothetical protein [Boseongicola sp.]